MYVANKFGYSKDIHLLFYLKAIERKLSLLFDIIYFILLFYIIATILIDF